MKPCTIDFGRIYETYATPDPWSEPTAECPPLDRLRAAAAAESPLEERRAVLEHALGCRYCAESWRLALQLGARPRIPLWYHVVAIILADLRSLADLAGRVARSAPVSRLVSGLGALAPRARTWRLVVLASASVTAVGLISLVSGPPSHQQGSHRGGTLEPPASPTITSLVPESASLSRGGFVLRWSGPPGASFDLRVRTPEGGLVAAAMELAASEYQVPEEDLRRIASGELLTWSVSARLEDGRRVKAQEFKVRVK